MPYRKTPRGHTEFGGGPGLIDPQLLKDDVLSAEERLMLMHGSNPMNPNQKLTEVNLETVPQPEPYEWPDKKTRKGTVEP